MAAAGRGEVGAEGEVLSRVPRAWGGGRRDSGAPWDCRRFCRRGSVPGRADGPGFRLQIGNRRLDPFGVVAIATQAGVAFAAKQAAHPVGLVTVVDAEPFRGF